MAKHHAKNRDLVHCCPLKTCYFHLASKASITFQEIGSHVINIK